MIPVRVAAVSASNVGFLVLLKSMEDPRSLPIFIGVPEAQAIAIQLNGLQPPRPLTHDLLKSVIETFHARLARVEVHDLREGTFYGRLVLDVQGETIEVDSRPSDAIALALRTGSPIFVAESVMNEAGVEIDMEKLREQSRTVYPEQEPGEEAEEGTPSRDVPGEPPPPPDPVARLQAELAKAVEEERYEDAARIRDELRKLTGSGENSD